MKIVISRTDKLGDVTLALHAIKQLKKLRPEYQVYLQISPYSKPLVENIKFLDGFVMEGDDLAQYNFDVSVDLMAKLPRSWELFKAKIPRRIGNSARVFSWLYTETTSIRRSYGLINEAEYNWKLISLIDPELRNTTLTSFVDESDFKEISEYDSFGQCILMPGISVSAISFNNEKWLEIANGISEYMPTIIFLGPAEENRATYFRENVKSNVKVEVFSDLKLALGALKNCDTYVGPSTGITHFANCFRKKGIAIYPNVRKMKARRWLPFQSSLDCVLIEKIKSFKDIEGFFKGTAEIALNPLKHLPVSAFVICKNEEKNIERCLKSLTWCDEIIVVDNGSTDKTLEIAKRFTDKVFFNEWKGFSAQKAYALSLCKNDWVINIDSDEEVSPELRGAICSHLSLENKVHDTNGFEILRVVKFLDIWWDAGGWYPEYRLRFFNKNFTKWGGIDPHEHAIVEGKVKRLKKGEIYHYTYQNFHHMMECLNRHSLTSATALHKKGVNFKLYKLIFNPVVRFFKFYVIKRGFKYGLAGFIVAVLECIYTFLKYAKLWELGRKGSNS